MTFRQAGQDELGTPRYNGQNVGPQWCPLQRGSTVYVHDERTGEASIGLGKMGGMEVKDGGEVVGNALQKWLC